MQTWPRHMWPNDNYVHVHYSTKWKQGHYPAPPPPHVGAMTLLQVGTGTLPHHVRVVTLLQVGAGALPHHMHVGARTLPYHVGVVTWAKSYIHCNHCIVWDDGLIPPFLCSFHPSSPLLSLSLSLYMSIFQIVQGMYMYTCQVITSQLFLYSMSVHKLSWEFCLHSNVNN